MENDVPDYLWALFIRCKQKNGEILGRKTGVKVIRTDKFQLTVHPIPHTKFTIGYLPKGSMPTKQMLAELKKTGETEKLCFIQLEPNVESSGKLKTELHDLG